MDHVATCPSQVELQRLFQGELPGPKVEEFAHHLETCEACARTVASLPTDDTLADALRQQSTAPMAPLDPDLGRLMDRLRALRAPARGTAETVAPETGTPETGVSTPTGAGSDISPDASYDFLAPPQAPDEIGRLGPYRVLQVLGQGGMGMVFKAEDPRLDRLCALKTMLPEIARKPAMRDRFLREAKAAAKIEHDHIIPIYQVDEAGGVPYIAMPFLKGASLEDYLKQKEQGRAGAALTMPQIIKIAREIARGLAAAHERGMIHRDIKPANIWLDGSAGGRVKILDFGLARLSQAAGEQNLTQSGAIMGTPSYMAPEQAQAQKLDGRADLFSLGVILYRLCTGELPFKGHDPISTLMALAMHNPPPPSQVNPAIPPSLSDLVMRLLAKDPAQRTASANDVLRELQAVGAGLSAGAGASSPVSAASITPGVEAIQIDQSADSRMSTTPHAPSSLAARLRQSRPLFRRPAAIAAIAAGLLAVIVFGTVYWIQTRAGVIRVEITDPDIEVAIKGTELTFTGADARPVSVRPGEGEKVFVVTRGDFTFETNKLVLKKGDDTTVKVDLLDGVVQVTADGQPIGAKALVAPTDALAAGSADYALDFDGQSNWVHIPTLSTDGTHPLTVECWINPRRIEGNQPAIKMAGPGSLGLHIGQDHIVANCFQGGSPHGVRMAAADKRDRWSHVACVWDGAEFRLYLDGRRCGEAFSTKAKPHEPKMTMLGGCPPELNVLTSAAGYFDGVMNEVRFSSVARYTEDFTPERRFEPDASTMALYDCDEGAGEILKDASGNGHDGRVVGAKWVQSDVPVATSVLAHAWPADAPPPAIAPFDAAQARAHQEAWAAHLGVPVEYTNSIGMKFRLIPPGEFMMGSTPEEIDAALKVATDEHWQAGIRSEAPRHQVVLTRPIYLGVHEVTQGQYEKLIGKNPSFFASEGGGRDAVVGMDTTSHPVEMVSWNDAADFCAKLSQQEQLRPFYFRSGETVTMPEGTGYRLPTEAEWEFACRAGTTTRHWGGDEDERLIESAWFGANGGGRTHAVGELKPNPFGLHDMQGNTWEWVQDSWDPNEYGPLQGQPAVDLIGPTPADSRRVLRGGHWYHAAAGCRAAFRYDGAVTDRGNTNGFRVALSVDAVRQPKGHALLFDDRTDAVDLSAVTYDSSHDLTIEGWFKSLEFGHCEFARFEPDGPVLFAMPKGEKGEIGAQWKDQDGRDVYAVCIDALRVGQPQHIALVYRRQRMLIFVDGTPIAESEVPTRPDAMKRLQLTNTLMELQGLRVSRVSRYTIPFQPEARFSADEQTIALFHCDEGEGEVLTDSSGNGFHGRITGAKWVPRDPATSPEPQP